MANLYRVAVLGLDRLGASVAMRLKTYAEKGGQHRFELVGYDSREDFEKPVRKAKIFDKVERHPHTAVAAADIVMMNLPYEDVQAAYETLGPDMREGAVVLDTSVIKQPSLRWAEKHLSREQHWIGFTPIVSSDYMLDQQLNPEYASDDYFHESTIFLTPAVSSVREAIDLAVGFASILGGRPHFLDPAEHDSLTTVTEEIPQVLSVAAFASAMRHNAWRDARRLTNPPFNVLTRYLLTHHPDALRDEWLENGPTLVRAIDDLLVILKDLRAHIATGDEPAIEAFLIDAADDYQEWINKRHKGSWDDDGRPKVQLENTVAGSLFGSAISRRLFGGKNDRDD